MAKVMIWPDVYREHGHWLPAVNLAKSLKDAGHTVEFMGIPDCASIVSPYGATFRPVLGGIYPVGHTLNDRLEPVGQRWKPHHLLPMCRGQGGMAELFAAGVRPNVLVAGYFAGLEALILHHKYQVPIVLLTTYLRHPDEEPALFAKTKLLFMHEQVAQKIMNVAMGKVGTDATLEEFLAPLEQAKELIPCPRDFDYFDDDWEHGSSVTYVEPMVTRVPLDPAITLPTNPTNLNPAIPTEGKKIIFATSGSQVADYEDKARQYFQALIGMMQTPGMEGYHLVLAMGDKLLAELNVLYQVDIGKSSLPSNVTLSAWVSQLEILKTAEVVFMHGGLATIKESIWEQVPIVIFPHGKDQMDNALRIERAGIGIAPKVDVMTPQALRQALTQVTASPWIKQRLEGMRALFAAKDAQSPKPSVQIIINAASA
ncbi:MAG: glycosyltransferase [Myxococcales bacterium]|nr:MAG: glycosyltransferase [Myxococcales bacterium]